MINQEFESISHIIAAFPNEQSCLEHLEKIRWEYYVISPFDASSKVYQCSNHLYKCKNTGKYFNVKTGTLFHNSKIELQKWFIAIWLLTEKNIKMTSVALGKELAITQKTAWYMIKRIQSYYKTEHMDILGVAPLRDSVSVPKITQNTQREDNKLQLLDWLALYQSKE